MKKLLFFSLTILLFISCSNEETNNEFEIANLTASSCNLTNPNRITNDESSYSSDDETCNGFTGNQFSCFASRIARAVRTELNNTRAFNGRQLLSRDIVDNCFNSGDCGGPTTSVEDYGIEIEPGEDLTPIVPAEIGNMIYQLVACEMKAELEEQSPLPNPNNQLYIVSDIFINWELGFGGPVIGWSYNIERLTFAE